MLSNFIFCLSYSINFSSQTFLHVLPQVCTFKDVQLPSLLFIYVLRNPQLATTCTKRTQRAKQRRRMPFEFLKRIDSICSINNIMKMFPCLLVPSEISMVPVYFGVWNFMSIWLKWTKFLVKKIILTYPSYFNPSIFHFHPNPL